MTWKSGLSEEFGGRAADWRPASNEVRSAISRQGYWRDEDEWRISTITSSRIEPIGRPASWGPGPEPLYQVNVKCDHEFACIAPTIERAAEFVGIYKVLIMELFWTYGWPSWVAKGTFDPRSP